MQRRFFVARVEERLYRDAPFLNNRITQQLGEFYGAGLGDMIAAFGQAARQEPPAAYIFQLGHCGSTLISRALGSAPEVLSLREPLLLKTLSGLERRIRGPLSWLSPADYERLEHITLSALERRFRPDQLPVVKVTSTGTNLLPRVMGSHGSRLALLLVQSLEAALAGQLRHQHRSSHDLLTQAPVRIEDWHLLTGKTSLRLYDADFPTIAVISWLTNIHAFMRALSNYPGRVHLLNFTRFLEDPNAHLEHIAGFIGRADSVGSILESYRSLSREYSKSPGKPFSAADRLRVLTEAGKAHAGQVASGLALAEQLLDEEASLAGLRRFIGQHEIAIRGLQ
ncbi:MAG: hypothetical protein R3348_04355 [Xanthomonadales bacterium]|nr:hypothetical protein [Xanthomonadales bacterium]